MGSKFQRNRPINLILADRDPSFRRICRETITRQTAIDITLYEADSADTLAVLVNNHPDALLFLDSTLFPGTKTSPVSSVKNLGHGGAILVCTPDTSISAAISFVRDGAEDVLAKPSNEQAIARAVASLLEVQKHQVPCARRSPSSSKTDFAGFVGRSTEMQSVYSQIQSIAKSSAPAFITGESGTGKELCAEAIHQLSARSNRRLVSLNCSAIPNDLMESEIFGHTKGAFTGAIKDRPGAAELADGGTLFLDEICEMDISLQAKLLRFIQTGTIRRVGGSVDIKVDIRFVCATNRDPLEAMHTGNFREDLYYRLHVIPVHLSPLRDRIEDILPIALSYLDHCASEENSSFRAFSKDAVQILKSYDWPGNVRQLQNIIRRLVVLNDGELIDAEMLRVVLNQVSRNSDAPGQRDPVESTPTNAILPLAVQERNIIENTLNRCGGNIVEAANALAISPSTIYRKLQAWQNQNPNRKNITPVQGRQNYDPMIGRILSVQHNFQ